MIKKLKSLVLTSMVTPCLFSSITTYAAMDSSTRSAQNQDQIKKNIENKNSALEKKYAELSGMTDTHYLESDAACYPIRQNEIREQNEKIQSGLREQKRIEDLIVKTCRKKNYVALKEEAQSAFFALNTLFEENGTSSIGYRAHHNALSKDAYDMLTYDKLDEVLKTKCYPGKDYLQKQFRLNVIAADIIPQIVGVVAPGVAGKYLVVKFLLKPSAALLVSRGFSVQKLEKISLGFKRLVIPAIVLTAGSTVYGAKQKYDKQTNEKKVENIRVHLSLETTFPEPSLEMKLDDCLGALEQSNQAPTNDLKNFWHSLADSKCRFYIQSTSYSIKLLTENDYNRCHPGNKGALERIENNFIDFIQSNPEYLQDAQKIPTLSELLK